MSPYLGAGIGVARVSLDGYTSSGTLIVDDSDTVFAGQLSAGVLYALNEQVSLDLGYRITSYNVCYTKLLRFK